MNNPAGRLYAILSRYEETRAKSPSTSLEATWAGTLGLRGVELRVALARAASLVPSIAEAAANFEADTGDSSSRVMVATHAAEWLKPIVLSPIAGTSAVNTAASVVDTSAMVALSSFSFTLSSLCPEGDDLDDDALRSLGEEVSDVLALVRSSGLPDPLKRLVVDCLHAVTDALDHYEFGGSGDVEAAYDRLFAALARTYVEHHEDPWYKRASDALKNGYAALGIAVTVSDGGQLLVSGIEALEQITVGN